MEIVIMILVVLCIGLFCYYVNESGKIYTQGVIKGKYTNYSLRTFINHYYLTIEYDYIVSGTKIPVKKSIEVEVTKELYDKVGIDVFFTLKVSQ